MVWKNYKMYNSIKILLLILSLLLLTLLSVNGQVNIESQRGESDNGSISNQFKLTGSYASGNSDYLGLAAKWTGQYKKKDFSGFVISSGEYKSGINKRLVNKAFLHLREMYKINSIFVGEFFQQAEFNEFIKLNLRALVGTDARISLIDDSIGKNNHIKSSLGIGIMYEYEEYADVFRSEFDLLRSTNYLAFYWDFSESASLDMTGYYQPSITNLDNYRLLFDSNLKFKIGKYVKFVFNFDYRHDNQPVEDVEKFDLSIKNGIEISF